MAIKIGAVNNKGGVGKSTLTANLGADLAVRFPNKKVLMIDTDGQGNLATSFNITKKDEEGKALLPYTIADVLRREVDAMQSIYQIPNEKWKVNNLYLLPSMDTMNNFWTREMLRDDSIRVRDLMFRMKETFAELDKQFDIILIDVPPTMELTFANVLLYADYVFIPFQPEYFSYDGVHQILEDIQELGIRYEQVADLLGIVVNLKEGDTPLHNQLIRYMAMDCRKHKVTMFDTQFTYSKEIAKAPFEYGMPFVWKKRNHLNSKKFESLWVEFESKMADLSNRKQRPATTD